MHVLRNGCKVARQKEASPMAPGKSRQPDAGTAGSEYAEALEQATRGLLELNVAVLEHLEKQIGLAPLRALQALDRRGPSLVTELGDELDLLPSTASRLSDRLANAGLITRSVSPTNRRATVLDLTNAGRTILTELITLRTRAILAITDQMSKNDRDALLRAPMPSLPRNTNCPITCTTCRTRRRPSPPDRNRCGRTGIVPTPPLTGLAATNGRLPKQLKDAIHHGLAHRGLTDVPLRLR